MSNQEAEIGRLRDTIASLLADKEALKAENERLWDELIEVRRALAIADEMVNSHTNIEKAAS